MTQTIERVETHLYRRRYQTSRGEWRILYYVNFVDWKQRRRSFPVGTDLKIAKDQKTLLEGRNIKHEDFDADKLQRHKGIIFSDWAALYFKEKVDPEKRASGVERERRSFNELDKFFGPLPLASINRGKVREYAIKRQQEPIRRRGKVFHGTRISFSTVNRELSFLRSLLNIAVDEEVIEAAPVMKLPSEAGRRKTRTIDPEEYGAILPQLKRPQQRYIIALFETSMRLNEPRALTWDKIDLKKGLIRLPAADVKEKWPRCTPISWELRQVLEELKEEQKKVTNLGNVVFTRPNGRPIKSITKALEFAIRRAKLESTVRITPHAFRRTSITRWTAAGIPRDIVMAVSGHKPSGVHDGYINFSDQQLTDAFSELMLPPEKRRKEAVKTAVSA